MIQYVVDAFTDRIFSRNPAAVCIADRWPSGERMQDIAKENNLSETAFSVREGAEYGLRWFTPGGEIDLCGHATLATAYVIMNHYEPEKQTVRFRTESGILTVSRKDGLYEMDFPAYPLRPMEITDEITAAIGVKPKEVYLGRDLLCVLEQENDVRSIAVDLERSRELEGLLLHVTAQGKEYDCVSRSFAPKLNVPEDPVCGSGHCHIVPYWAAKTGKQTFTACQASPRGGVLYCRMNEGRVILGGNAVVYSRAELFCG